MPRRRNAVEHKDALSEGLLKLNSKVTECLDLQNRESLGSEPNRTLHIFYYGHSKMDTNKTLQSVIWLVLQ